MGLHRDGVLFSRVDCGPVSWGEAVDRRDFIRLVAGASAVWPARAMAQTRGKTYRIGLLGRVDNKSPFDAPLTSGLAKRGYIVNRNLAFEYRPAEQATAL